MHIAQFTKHIIYVEGRERSWRKWGLSFITMTS